MPNEVGRELKASELKRRTVVVVEKPDSGMATFWVVDVGDVYVHLRAGVVGVELFLMRCGKDLERVTDDSHAVMTIYEYLGEV